MLGQISGQGIIESGEIFSDIELLHISFINTDLRNKAGMT